MHAYVCAMQHDPLLPHDLLPGTYMGQKAFELHKRIVKEIRRRM